MAGVKDLGRLFSSSRSASFCYFSSPFPKEDLDERRKYSKKRIKHFLILVELSFWGDLYLFFSFFHNICVLF